MTAVVAGEWPLVHVEDEADHLGRLDNRHRFLDEALGRSVRGHHDDEAVHEAREHPAVRDTNERRRIDSSSRTRTAVGASRSAVPIAGMRRIGETATGSSTRVDCPRENGDTPGRYGSTGAVSARGSPSTERDGLPTSAIAAITPALAR